MALSRRALARLVLSGGFAIGSGCGLFTPSLGPGDLTLTNNDPRAHEVALTVERGQPVRATPSVTTTRPWPRTTRFEVGADERITRHGFLPGPGAYPVTARLATGAEDSTGVSLESAGDTGVSGPVVVVSVLDDQVDIGTAHDD